MSKATRKQDIVKFGEKQIAVKKVNLKKITLLLSMIDLVPKEMLNAATDNGEVIKIIMQNIDTILSDGSDIVCKVLDGQITPEELQEADFEEVVDLVEVFLTINNIPKIMARVGNVRALTQGAKIDESKQVTGS